MGIQLLYNIPTDSVGGLSKGNNQHIRVGQVRAVLKLQRGSITQKPDAFRSLNHEAPVGSMKRSFSDVTGGDGLNADGFVTVSTV